MTLKEALRISLIRTLVPIVVAFISLAALRLGVKVDDATIATAATSAITFGYYAVVRVLESRWQKAGKLLGAAKPPIYDNASAPIERRAELLAQQIRQQNLRRGTSYPDDPTPASSEGGSR